MRTAAARICPASVRRTVVKTRRTKGLPVEFNALRVALALLVRTTSIWQWWRGHTSSTPATAPT